MQCERAGMHIDGGACLHIASVLCACDLMDALLLRFACVRITQSAREIAIGRSGTSQAQIYYT